MAAQQLRSNGFTPSDSKPWFQSGINNPQTIITWHRSQFAAEEAALWMSKKISIEEAKEYRKKGLTVDN
jgi:hypothetical protein